MKRLRLRREVCFMLGAVVMCMIIMFMNSTIESYNDYLQKCDETKGYTCNIFGK